MRTRQSTSPRKTKEFSHLKEYATSFDDFNIFINNDTVFLEKDDTEQTFEIPKEYFDKIIDWYNKEQ